MKVSVIWEHGEITILQSFKALNIALEWLYYKSEVLAVFCITNNTLYLKSVEKPTIHYL